MFDLKIVDDIKEIHNLGRIRSKKLLNLLDLISICLKKKTLVFFSYTINIGFFNEVQKDLMKTWVEDLKSFTEKLNDFINKDVENQFTMYSIEMHRATRTLTKKNNKIMPLKKENSLKGYPHIHVFSAYNVENVEDINYKKHVIESKILDFFLNYDIKINNISEQKQNIKNSIKYVIKEYKFTDIADNLDQLDLKENVKVFVNDGWSDLKNVLVKLNSINNVKMDLTYKINYLNLTECIKDPLYKIKNLLDAYLISNNLKLYNSKIYTLSFKYSNSKAWFYICNLEDCLIKLAADDLSNSNLILSNISKFCKLIRNNDYVFDQIGFNDFMYIQYKTFYLNLHHVKIENINLAENEKQGDWDVFRSFNYFDKDKKDLLELQDGVDLLRNIFNNDKDFFSYLLFMGKLLSQSYKKGKNKTLYLYGPSNSGKTLLTEKFLREIFGDENIGILNTTDSKFFLDQVCDKHIIILNEFKYSPNKRELLLKFLDGSLIPINRKYKDSIKITLDSFTLATSNLSLKEQNMDEAFNNRLLSVQTKNEISSSEYHKIIKALPLIILYCLFSLLVPDYKNLEVYVYNQLEDSSKSITVI